jgi:hypothetical protein
MLPALINWISLHSFQSRNHIHKDEDNFASATDMRVHTRGGVHRRLKDIQFRRLGKLIWHRTDADGFDNLIVSVSTSGYLAK